MNTALHNRSYEQSCQDALKLDGGRITQGRLAIIGEMAQARSPLTAKDLMQSLNRHSLGIDMVSIYRTLAKMTELGLVHETSPGHFLACRHLRCSHEAHVLVKCLSCGRLEESEIPETVLSPLVQHLRKNHKFEPDRHVLRVDGHCQKCQRPS